MYHYMEISRAALRRNAAAIRSYVGVPVIAVLKCDGYGVSITEAAHIWKEAGAAMFAVAQPEEALALRRAGFEEEILLTSPVADASILSELLRHKVILTITNLQTAEFYSLYANSFPIRVHVAIDTGMGRFGIRWNDFSQLHTIYSMEHFSFEGIFSHFSHSFEKRYRKTALQLSRFLHSIDAITGFGFSVGIRHIANSCAALRFPETWLDAVRIGSGLVGRLCAPVPVSLVPVGRFYAQVIDVKHFHRGDHTGYASLCRIRKDTDAVIVAIGRMDGFGLADVPEHFRLCDFPVFLQRTLRQYFKRPYVMYRGNRLPLIGRVGTQFSLFDTRGIQIRPGTYVIADIPLLFPGTAKRFI